MSKPKLITAWAEAASGPGWANSPVWYLVMHTDGLYEVGCLQPEEHSDAMAYLYPVSQIAHEAMTNAVRKAMKGRVR